MKSKSATVRQRGKRANAEVRKAGRVDGSTQIATVNLTEAVARLYSEGRSIDEICKRVSREKSTVYNALAKVRLELIGKKKEYFDDRLALYLDDALDNTATHQQLMQDEDFLRTADPERLKAIGSNFGIISDKVFVLLAASARGARFAQPAQSESPAPVPGAGSVTS
jgi:hypothetical protein